MNHNYRLGDFITIIKEPDADIYERIVSVDLSNIREIPFVIASRLESIINRMISDYEQERNLTIPLEVMELGMYMDVDTAKNELSLNAYIGYAIEEECIAGKEIITDSDEDYEVIKKFFFTELNHYVFEQLRRIENCA